MGKSEREGEKVKKIEGKREGNGGKWGEKVKIGGKWEKVRGKCGGKGKEKGKVEEKWRKE